MTIRKLLDPSECARASAGDFPEPEHASLAALTAVVEKALAMADDMELAMVGIDLCTALERIKAMGDSALPFFVPPDCD